MTALDVLTPTVAPDVAGRADRVRAALDGRTLLVTDLVNIRWLTGFTGSSAWLVVAPDRMVLGTDGRYRDRAAAELGIAGVDAEIVVTLDRDAQRAATVAALVGAREVAADPAVLSHTQWTDLAGDVPLVELRGAVEAARRRKDAGEIDRIAIACRIADAALARVAPRLGDGLTEVDVRDELEVLMRRFGADGPSYATIVASGPSNAARPHHEPERRVIVDGDTVVIDVGALVDGYHSDMTRSYVVGDPTVDQQRWYDLVLEAQLAGLATVRAGVAARDVDAAARGCFEQAGMADDYLHSTGHGVGLLIHEDPFESRTSQQELLAGDVVTVEPGLYRLGFGGVRIEDLVVVTDTGCQILTTTPKDTPCLPSPPTT